jgi:hypothetical protein
METKGMNGFEALEKTTPRIIHRRTPPQNKIETERGETMIQITSLDPKLWITLFTLFAFLLGLGRGTIGGFENV